MTRRRGVLLGVALALAAIVAIVGFFVFAGLQSTPADATLTIYAGSVQLERSGQRTFHPAQSGDTLHNGDSLQTSKPSRSAIVFGDGSIVRLDSCTDITVKNAQRQNGAFHTEIAQFSGKTWNKVARLVGGSTYKVDGPNNSTAEARGTAFAVLTNVCGSQPGVKPTVTYDTFAGSIDVTAANKTVTVNTGFHTDVNAPGAPPSTPVPIPPAEANDLWIITNQSQDANPAPAQKQLPPSQGDVPPGTKVAGTQTVQGNGSADITETLYWPGSCFTLTATLNGEDFETISSCTPPTTIILAKAQVGTWGYWISNDQSAPAGDPWAVDLGVLDPSQNTPTPFFSSQDCSGAVTAGQTATLKTPKAKSSAGPPALSVTGLPTWATFTDNKDGTGSFSFSPPSSTAATSLNLTLTASIDGGTASLACTESVRSLPRSSSIAGHVRTQAGTGVSGVTLTLTAADGSTTTTLTDASGAYVFSGLGLGTYNVTVGTPTGDAASGPTGQNETVDGTNSQTNVDFTLIPPAGVSGISPTTGPVSGGTRVTITGSGFTPATGVTFGGTAAPSFTVNSDTQITATSPAHSPGTVDIQVVDAAGNSLTGSGDLFTYTSSAPAVTQVSPSVGPLGGGGLVTISGAGFFGPATSSTCNVTGIVFGAAAATLPPTACSDTAVQVVAPAAPGGTPATVDVRVTTSLGTSATSSADHFTYAAAPTVAAVSPARGPLAGGQTVTVSGTGFQAGGTSCGVTRVTFGGNSATPPSSCSDTSLTVASPSNAAGTVDVTITTAGGTSAVSSKDTYAYVAAPYVTAVSPTTLPSGSTQTVTVGGTGFYGGLNGCNVSQVLFGTTPGTAVACTSDTQLTVSAPGLSGVGPVDVYVVTDGGASPAYPPYDQISFAAPLAVTAGAATLTPDSKQSDGFTSTPSGGSGPYAFSWAFGDGGGSTAQNPSYAYSSTGPFTATVTVTDSIGSTPASASLALTVSSPPTISSVTPSATAVDSGDAVTFNAAVSNGTAPLAYSWNFGDGTTVVGAPPISHTFTTAAATVFDSVALTVTDANGFSATNSTVTITVNPALTAGASANAYTGVAPFAVSFTGSETGGTSPFTWSWAFGDGGASTAQSPSYTYNSYGHWNAVLTVSDAAGHSASAPLAITAAYQGCLYVKNGTQLTLGAGLYLIPNTCVDPYNQAGVLIQGTLTLDASLGPVQIQSEGPPVKVCTTAPATEACLPVTGHANLETINTGTNNVVFGSLAASPSPGAWTGIQDFNGGSISLSNAVVDDGGDDIYASNALCCTTVATGANVSLTNVTLSNASSRGISDSWTPLTISGGTIKHTLYEGVNASGAIGVSISGLTVTDSGYSGVGVSGVYFVGSGASSFSLVNSTFSNIPGAAGLNVWGVAAPVVQNNTFTGTGTAAAISPAMWLHNLNTVGLGTQIAGNTGSGNGIDAFAFDGTFTSGFAWQPVKVNSPGQPLGYTPDNNAWIIMDGPSTVLTIPAGAVLKFGGVGLQVQNGAQLVAGDTTNGGVIFTADEDTTAGYLTCPTTFTTNCTPTANDWSGLVAIQMGSNGSSITLAGTPAGNSQVRYANRGIDADNSVCCFTTAPGGFINLTNVSITSSYGYGISDSWTPLTFIGGTVIGAGFDGILVSGSNATLSGLTVSGAGNLGTGAGIDIRGFNGGVNHLLGPATRLAALVAPPNVSVTNNTISGSTAQGLFISDWGNPIVQNNTLTGNGNGATKYPAVELQRLFTGSFSSSVANDTGSGNGMDVIAFDGTLTSSLNWIPAVVNSSSTSPLGYLPSGWIYFNATGITVTIPGGTVVKSDWGIDFENGAHLAAGDSSNGVIFTSDADNSAGVVTCPSNFQITCTPAAGNWSGLNDSGGSSITLLGSANSVSQIRYAYYGIYANNALCCYSVAPGADLSLSNVNISSSYYYAVYANWTPLSYINGTVSGAGSDAIFQSGGAVTLSNLTVTGAGNLGPAAGSGIHIDSAAGVTVTGNTVSGASQFGVYITNVASPTFQNNTLTGNGNGTTKYPAAQLSGLNTGTFATSASNDVGNANGLDVIAFDGTLTASLNWLPAVVNGSPGSPLGYLPSGWLYFNGSSTTLTIPAGTVIKELWGIEVDNGAKLVAGDTTNGGVTFTSEEDDSVGVKTCSSVYINTCTPAAGQWNSLRATQTAGTGSAISLQGTPSSNTKVLYASYGINVDNSVCCSTVASGANLSLTNVSITSSYYYGIYDSWTPVSFGGGGVSGAGYDGIYATGGGAASLSNLTISGTGSFGPGAGSGINIQGAGAASVTATTVSGATAYGIFINGVASPTLVGNTLTGNGTGTTKYPAAQLSNLNSGTFATSVAGNSGNANGIDAIAFDGTLTAGLTWVPAVVNATSSTPLGFLPSGWLYFKGSGTTLTIPAGAVVKSLWGLEVDGGATLVAGDTTSGGVTFTSDQDDSGGGVKTCSSVFTSTCAPAAGNWSGLRAIQSSGSGAAITLQGTASSNTKVLYAARGIYADNQVCCSAVASGANLSLTNVSITSSYYNGVYASWSPLSFSGGIVSGAGYDAIYQNGQVPVSLSSLTVSGGGNFGPGYGSDVDVNSATSTSITGSTFSGASSYGVFIAGVSSPTFTGNTLTGNGTGTTKYPAAQLSGLNTGTFATSVAGNSGNANGIDAVAFDGTFTSSFTWLGAGVNAAPSTPLGYLPSGWLYFKGSGTTLNIAAGAVIKSLWGLEFDGGAALVAGNANGGVTFTSDQDSSVLAATCTSVFVNNCTPAPNNWTGLRAIETSGTGSAITLQGTPASNTKVLYAGHGIYADNGVCCTTAASGGSLSLTNVTISSSYWHDIYANWTPLTFSGGTVSGAGYDAISQSGAVPVSLSGLTVSGGGNFGPGYGSDINISGASSASVSGSTISGASTFGALISGVASPTFTGNTLTGNGTGTTKYPAAKLTGLNTNSFATSIASNTGNANGIDALTFDGTLFGGTPITWVPAVVNATPSTPLGYLPSGWLYFNGAGTTLTIPAGSVVKSLWGLEFDGGAALVAGDTTNGGVTFTSDEDNSVLAATCTSIFVNNCTPAPNNWTGLRAIQTSGTGSAITLQGTPASNTKVLYAGHGIYADNGVCCTTAASGGSLSLTNVTISSSYWHGVYDSWTPLTFSGGTVSGAGYDAIYQNGAASFSVSNLNVSGGGNFGPNYGDGINVNGASSASIVGTTVAGSTLDGIDVNTVPGAVTLTGDTIQTSSLFGLKVSGATNPTLQSLTLNGNGTGTPKYPAALLTGLTVNVSPAISGLNGSGNGVDLVALDGTIGVSGFAWQAPAPGVLGYTLSRNAITVSGSGVTLSIPGGSVIKGGSGSAGLSAQAGATISVGDASSSGVVLTSATDDSVTPATCLSWLDAYNRCTPGASDWSGISASSGNLSIGTATSPVQIKYATVGIQANNPGPCSPTGGCAYSLAVANTTISNSWGYGIYELASATTITSPVVISGTGSNYGFYVGPGAASFSVSGLKVTGAASYGLYAAIPASITCSTFTGNKGGVTFTTTSGPGNSIGNSNLYSNTSSGIYDLLYTGSGGVTAQGNWWGQTGGPVTGQVSGTNVSTSSPLTGPASCAPTSTAKATPPVGTTLATPAPAPTPRPAATSTALAKPAPIALAPTPVPAAPTPAPTPAAPAPVKPAPIGMQPATPAPGSKP